VLSPVKVVSLLMLHLVVLHSVVLLVVLDSVHQASNHHPSQQVVVLVLTLLLQPSTVLMPTKMDASMPVNSANSSKVAYKEFKIL